MTIINICDYSIKNNVGVTRIFTKMKLRRCTMSENHASMNSFPTDGMKTRMVRT